MTAAAAADSVGISSQTAGTKLSTPEVFDRIREITCRVLSSAGNSTGFLVGVSGEVLTVKHIVRDETASQITIRNNGVSYSADKSPGMNDKHAQALDLFSLKTEISGYKPVEEFRGGLIEGMTVYFSGYPLGQESMTFHKGTISSTTRLGEKVISFTIDGTVVPGCSGGPVVIQERGSVFLIGMITSEIADLGQDDLQMMRIMAHLVTKSGDAGEDAMATIHSGEAFRYYYDPATSGSDEYDGDYLDKLVRIGDHDIISRTMGLLSKNLSTGVGRATSIQFKDMLFQSTDVKIPKGIISEVLVNGPAKSPVRETIHPDKEKRPGLKSSVTGTELRKESYRPLGDAGFIRGIKVGLPMPYGSHDYGIQPDPHDLKSAYTNLGQATKFYKKATFSIVEAYCGTLAGAGAPQAGAALPPQLQTVTFKFSGVEFTATAL